MNKMAKKRRPRFLIPLLYQQKNQNIIQIAKLFSKIDAVQVIGIVTLPENKELSEGVNNVRALRSFLAENINESESNIHTEVQVTHDTWNLIKEIVEKTYPKVHTLILEWPHQIAEMAIDLKEVLNNQFCNIAITRGQFKDPYENILIPIRGGPRSIEALRMSLKLSEFFNAQITIERIFNSEAQRIEIDDDFLAIQRVLDEIPGIKQKNTISKNVSQAILESACQNDIVLLGAGTPENNEPSLFGTITSKILDGCEADVIAIKTRVRAEPHTPLFTSQAISVLVDKWFAENTFDAEEFKNIEQLVDKKESKGLTISLALPALNEEETVGNVIQIAKTEFMERYPLIDEIILVDSGSTDRTRDIAKKMGIPVYLNQEVLSNYGFRNGKGEVLWKSLYLTNGDIVFWVDTDIHNFNPKFIYGVLGPMIMDDRIKFVKGFYKRPIMGKNGIVHPGGGGREQLPTALFPRFAVFDTLSVVDLQEEWEVQPGLRRHSQDRPRHLHTKPVAVVRFFKDRFGLRNRLLVEVVPQTSTVLGVNGNELSLAHPKLDRVGKVGFRDADPGIRQGDRCAIANLELDDKGFLGPTQCRRAQVFAIICERVAGHLSRRATRGAREFCSRNIPRNDVPCEWMRYPDPSAMLRFCAEAHP